MLKRSHIAVLVGLIFSAGVALAQMTGSSSSTPGTTMGQNGPKQEVEARNVTLTAPLTVVIDAKGDTIVLPAGTMIGREGIESRVNANNVTVRQETELSKVTLVEPLTFTDPSGNKVTLPSGTVLRLESQTRFDANGNVVRNEFRLRALEPDGTVVRIRDRAPRMEAAEMEAAEMENESHSTGTTSPGSANSGPKSSMGPKATKQEVEARNVTLTAPLTVVIDAKGDTIVLPAGTMIGRQDIESRVNANNVTLRQETELSRVTLVADLTFTDPSGNKVTLPAGTVLRLQSQTRFDANGNVVRNEFRLRALEPDGTVVRIRDPAPRMEAAEMENETHVSGSSSRGSGTGGVQSSGRDSVGTSSRESGRDSVGASSRDGARDSIQSTGRGDNGGRMDRVARVDRPQMVERVQIERPQRVERPEVARVDRIDRPERSGRH